MKSVIISINPEYHKTLMGFLAPVQVPGKEWEMCYRGSEQNISASAFHSLCDSKGPTVTLLRVNQNVFVATLTKTGLHVKIEFLFPNQILGSTTICRINVSAKTVFIVAIRNSI